ncbi:uncharacterized protein KNAG_0F00300 [Huiozyma naganishii CBS 8797]|uniref:NADH:flavin oxidoreductase/NADH oxidase N-terminal domain-containing protein n=1 Tax=Huiozyma naganishii (strain ATCC MYA-139 / BCRC 22969 / CBS 8797 / KCTC 17520 / NBRC 10181 / NCYC 3082 / Yp74L-3) TaxID=1071383 RepID=J7RZN9_HUIN7|nr:hypothetical protein KNAG_0F00300 [Kazachstania naganishii CBS 8797]CCK70702.1 hypothetical protein KNAG_0F00300 [Kazachstania naganishii CBS 8797]
MPGTGSSLGELVGCANAQAPSLFTPLKIKSLTVPNRIGVSPMCMNSAVDSKPTNFHQVHYGALALRGPGLIIVECSAVSPDGINSSRDLGLWDEMTAKHHYSSIVEFAHQHRGVIGCQLGSFKSPPIDHWSSEDIRASVDDWAKSSKLAVEVARYDFVEIQGSYGSPAQNFLFSATNHRQDCYGGPPSNRMRYLLDLARSVKANVDRQVPIFMRLTDCEKSEEEGAWTQRDTIDLCLVLAQLGIDVVDIVFTYKRDLKLEGYLPRKQFLQELRHRLDGRGLKLNLASPTRVNDGLDAENTIKDSGLDLILIGKKFLKDPTLVSAFASDLEVEISQPVQYHWGL